MKMAITKLSISQKPSQIELTDLEEDILAAKTLSWIMIDLVYSPEGVVEWEDKISFLTRQIYQHLKSINKKYQEVCQNQREAA